MSRHGGWKHAYLSYSKEPEAREIKGLAQSHPAHRGETGLARVHPVPAPELWAPTLTPLPPLAAVETEAGEPLRLPAGGLAWQGRASVPLGALLPGNHVRVSPRPTAPL